LEEVRYLKKGVSALTALLMASTTVAGLPAAASACGAHQQDGVKDNTMKEATKNVTTAMPEKSINIPVKDVNAGVPITGTQQSADAYNMSDANKYKNSNMNMDTKVGIDKMNVTVKIDKLNVAANVNVKNTNIKNTTTNNITNINSVRGISVRRTAVRGIAVRRGLARGYGMQRMRGMKCYNMPRMNRTRYGTSRMYRPAKYRAYRAYRPYKTIRTYRAYKPYRTYRVHRMQRMHRMHVM
jgi:hypothetical protein